jgi:hypothetical protein
MSKFSKKFFENFAATTIAATIATSRRVESATNKKNVNSQLKKKSCP